MNCRLCGKENIAHDADMLKYGVRHYAHYECFLAIKGDEGLRLLPAWKIGTIPYRLLKQYNLEIVAQGLIREKGGL